MTWVKLQGRAADHLPPSNAKAKNGGDMPPLPHMSSWYSASLHNEIRGITILREKEVTGG
jgi:hypothetical protein